MKKRVCCVLALLLLLAGCGGAPAASLPPEPEEAPAPASQELPDMIAFSLGDLTYEVPASWEHVMEADGGYSHYSAEGFLFVISQPADVDALDTTSAYTEGAAGLISGRHSKGELSDGAFRSIGELNGYQQRYTYTYEGREYTGIAYLQIVNESMYVLAYVEPRLGTDELETAQWDAILNSVRLPADAVTGIPAADAAAGGELRADEVRADEDMAAFSLGDLTYEVPASWEHAAVEDGGDSHYSAEGFLLVTAKPADVDATDATSAYTEGVAGLISGKHCKGELSDGAFRSIGELNGYQQPFVYTYEGREYAGIAYLQIVDESMYVLVYVEPRLGTDELAQWDAILNSVRLPADASTNLPSPADDLAEGPATLSPEEAGLDVEYSIDAHQSVADVTITNVSSSIISASVSVFFKADSDRAGLDTILVEQLKPGETTWAPISLEITSGVELEWVHVTNVVHEAVAEPTGELDEDLSAELSDYCRDFFGATDWIDYIEEFRVYRDGGSYYAELVVSDAADDYLNAISSMVFFGNDPVSVDRVVLLGDDGSIKQVRE